MASGGGPPRKVSASEGRGHRTWKRSNSTADGDDNASMTSNPLDARPNNWVRPLITENQACARLNSL